MIFTPTSAALALALGVRHGLDADHLAAIDGLTRWNAGERRSLASYCGALFSAGHASVVLIASMALTLFAQQWTPPAWLGPTGAFISSVTLIALSMVNLHLAIHTPRQHFAGPTGIRSWAWGSVLRAPRAWQVMLVGALFALSFDAIALAALFASTGLASGGLQGASALALLFALGMIVVDAANGVWVARLVNRSDDKSRNASRIMTLTIAIVGIALGASVSLATIVGPLEQWLSEHELAVSSLVVAAVLCGYLASTAFKTAPR